MCAKQKETILSLILTYIHQVLTIYIYKNNKNYMSHNKLVFYFWKNIKTMEIIKLNPNI